MNLHFIENENTNGAPAKAMKGNVTSVNGIKYIEYVIRVNTKLLPSDASQDYKAAILIHEILHSYMLSNGSNVSSPLQHAEMVEHYAQGVAQLLHDVFGTSTSDAIDLAINGVKDFKDYHPTEYAQALSKLGTLEGRAQLTYETQRAGLEGRLCP